MSNNSLSVKIGGRQIDVESVESFPVQVSYKLEEIEDFEKKKGVESFDVTLPATLSNSEAFNSPHDPEIMDLTDDEFFSKPMPCLITANGAEILNGKAFLQEATHTDKPENITVDCYGGNGDWIIDLKEKTLLDFVNPNPHTFDRATQIASWSGFGTTAAKDFVYAPVRGRRPFGAKEYPDKADYAVTVEDLTPSLSPYWILRRAFNSLGYRLESTFMDSPFFRGLAMPWTWGSFKVLDEVLQKPFLFRAMCTSAERMQGLGVSWLEWVSPAGSIGSNLQRQLAWGDVSSGLPLGGYEGTPGALYTFDNKNHMNYKYPASSPFGAVRIKFEFKTYYYFYSSGGATAELEIFWFVTPAGQTLPANPLASNARAKDLLVRYDAGSVESGEAFVTREIELNPGETMTAIMRMNAPVGSGSSITWEIGQKYPAPVSSTYAGSYLEATLIQKPAGGTINLKEYPAFQKYGILDLLRGLCDKFDLLIGTDQATKTIRIENAYGVQLPNGTTLPGYLQPDRIDWTGKQDLSKLSTVKVFSDGERELVFKDKDDSADGGFKILNKRYNGGIDKADSTDYKDTASAVYLFPERFKEGKKSFENRFFTPVAHVQMQSWEGITGVKPQLVALIPENVSNTSAGEGAANFQPKLCFYKGLVSGVGGWRYRKTDGTVEVKTELPFMFSTNYNPGGHTDPCLTYNDQQIAGQHAPGLLRRFFLSRMAVRRHGKLYSTWMHLAVPDVAGEQFRQARVIGNSTYHVIEVDRFKPLSAESTAVTLWRFWPVTQKDNDSVFPSKATTLGGSPSGTYDKPYKQLLLLNTDLPTQ